MLLALMAMRRRDRLLLPLTFVAFALAIGCGAPSVSELSGGKVNRTPPPATPTPTNGRHHPVGFADPAQHGPYAKFLTENCTTCHGANLDGVGQPTAAYPDLPANGCDTCHASGWRTNCTYCHGGQDNQTGAPERDITELAGQTTANPLFKAHTQHVTAGADHVAYDCIQCHAAKPTDAMSPDHWIVGNVTPGIAPVVFPNGSLNQGGSFAGTGTGKCTNSYCHGNGQGNNGTVTQAQVGQITCTSCHGFKTSSTSMATMSGRHRNHEGIAGNCYTCHAATLDTNDAIAHPDKHVNRIKEVMFTGITMTYANGRCTGTCHGENHQSKSW